MLGKSEHVMRMANRHFFILLPYIAVTLLAALYSGGVAESKDATSFQRPKVPMLKHFPTLRSMIEIDEYYQQRAKEVPDLLTYNLVEEAQSPNKVKTVDDFATVLRLTNTKSEKSESEKKKILITASQNGLQSLGTDMWLELFVMYFTSDYQRLNEQVGIEDFWSEIKPYWKDKDMEQRLGGWGLFKQPVTPEEFSKMIKAEPEYKEDEDLIEISNAELSELLTSWTKDVLDHFIFILLPLVGRETRKQVEFGTYCYANSSDYQLPYWDFNVYPEFEPFLRKEQFSSTRLITKIVKSEKPIQTIALLAEGFYYMATQPGYEWGRNKGPKFDLNLQFALEDVSVITDIVSDTKGQDNHKRSGAMIDYLFEKQGIPMPLDFSIFSHVDIGLYKRHKQHIGDNREYAKPHFLRKASFDVAELDHGADTKDNFIYLDAWGANELEEFVCIQRILPLTAKQKITMMMKWLVGLHVFTRSMYQAKSWKQLEIVDRKSKLTQLNQNTINFIVVFVSVLLSALFCINRMYERRAASERKGRTKRSNMT